MKDPFKKFQAKTYVLICILIMSVPGILEYGYQNTIPQMLLAVLTAGLLDLLINKLKKDHSNITFKLLPPIGRHKKIIRAFKEVIKQLFSFFFCYFYYYQ